MIDQNTKRGDSPQVTFEQYRDAQERGRLLLDSLWVGDDDWSDTVDWAYDETRKSWGGVTIDMRTGDIVTREHGFAVQARMPGDPILRTPAIVSLATFEQMLTRARDAYPYAPYLGIFHDDDTDTIDFDPVVIVSNERDARDIATYTEATGGAYDFATGNGVFPYHVNIQGMPADNEESAA